MGDALRVLIVLISLVVIVATVLPVLRTTAGIVRICDFPRPQILTVGVAALVAIALLFDMSAWLAAVLFAATSLAVVAQIVCIAPYTPFYPKESAAAEATDSGECFTLLIANVRIDNRRSTPLLELIDRFDPDILLLVEVDRWWLDQLSTLRRRYLHVTAQPQDDGYGLVFMSRLPVSSCELRRLVKPNIPSVKARLQLKSGQPFWFHGLHPEPPGPIQDADNRNTELLFVAREVADADQATVVAGDLNDVAWSRTTNRFGQVSGLRDPRVGRGTFSTFHADHWFARWPLDHLFCSPDFAIRDLAVLPHIGSDHFPIIGKLSLKRRKNG